MFPAFPFSLGVASGAPRPTGVVLWTRLAPDPLNGAGLGPESVPVRWEVAHDEQVARLARSGTIDAVAGDAHSVHFTSGCARSAACAASYCSRDSARTAIRTAT